MRRVHVLLLAVIATAVAGASAPAARHTAPLPTVDGELPVWLAPGGRLVVSGWANANVRLDLVVGQEAVASTVSGPRGRFRLEGRAPRAGRYPVEVLGDDGSFLELGELTVRALLLAAVGDVTFGAAVADAISAHGPRYPWLFVRDPLRSADVAVANLEGVVSTRGTPWPDKEFHFRGPPAAVVTMGRFAGIDVASLANNHSLDFGRQALLDTVRHARRAGITPVGGGRDLATARRPGVADVGGLRIAFLAYSDVRPLGFDAGTGLPGAAPAFPHLIDPDVCRAGKRADLVVVYYHWGVERSRTPNQRQHELAAVALNAGATVVLGAHPHVLQPVTTVPGRRLVAWSLGNFVFAANSPGTADTGVLLVHLDRQGVSGHRLLRARINGVQPRLSGGRGLGSALPEEKEVSQSRGAAISRP